MRRSSVQPLLWVSVFGFEAVFKSESISHLLGALALGALFAALVLTELRSDR